MALIEQALTVRLRKGFGGLVPPVCEEAADEIERLRSALAHAINEADGWYDDAHGGECPNLDDCRKLLIKCR